jgi:HSP20 family protein
MEALRREIDRAFSSALAGNTGTAPVAFLPGYAARAYPLINLSEDKDNFYVEALAPGLDTQALNLTLVRNNLTISGEKLAPQGVAREAFHRSERAAGKFIRTIELPIEVDNSQVQARYVDGILKITLPKAEEAKPKSIQVNIS